MGSDDGGGAGASPADASPKRLSRKQRRLLVAALVFVLAMFLALWGAQPQEFVTPSQLAGNPSRYADIVIQLRGVVHGLNASAKTFVLGDATANVTVAYATLPEGFQVGKEVIAKGWVETLAPLVFRAQEIVVGHPR